MAENLIHIKIGYSEAIEAKKGILLSQMNLLKILNSIKKYHALRSDELKIKIRVRGRLKEVNKDIRKFQNILPKIKMPEILKKNKKVDESLEETKKISLKEKNPNNDIEFQLKEIQEKLLAIQ